jgi:NAD(P)-dependent dehydrogenase (short-subunit alcohol dehydrogenase family)
MLTAIYPSLAGKRVVITGGGSGLGAAMVESFVRQNAKVFFLDIAETDARSLESKLSGAAHPPVYHRCDLTSIQEIRATFAAIEASTGPVNVLINNAANDDRHELGDVTPEYWDNRIAVNLRHQFFCAQAVSAGMRAMGEGVILNVGSISWHLALADLSIYMTAKAGIEGLTKGLARDLGAFNIRVNCIVPGAVSTPRQRKLWQTPESEAQIVAAQCLKQRIEPEHVAAMALFLASGDSARCSGREYFVDAGWYGK